VFQALPVVLVTLAVLADLASVAPTVEAPALEALLALVVCPVRVALLVPVALLVSEVVALLALVVLVVALLLVLVALLLALLVLLPVPVVLLVPLPVPVVPLVARWTLQVLARLARQKYSVVPVRQLPMMINGSAYIALLLSNRAVIGCVSDVGQRQEIWVSFRIHVLVVVIHVRQIVHRQSVVLRRLPLQVPTALQQH